MESMETQSAQIDRLRKDLGTPPGDPASAASLLTAYETALRASLADWPAGLLLDGARTDLAGCQRLLGYVRHARDLDRSGALADFLPAMETRIQILIGQLRSDELRCTF
jgi:hypothetical protein